MYCPTRFGIRILISRHALTFDDGRPFSLFALAHEEAQPIVGKLTEPVCHNM